VGRELRCSVDQDALDEVRVTAERVGRFASEVEREGSDENRRLWRAALGDLRAAIRRARARGYDTEDIRAASGEQAAGRFVREPESSEQDTRPVAH